MDDAVKKIELLDRFIANEKKSRRFTIIGISFFCLLGLLIFFFAYKWNEKTKEFNSKLQSKNDSLKLVNNTLDSLGNSLAQMNVSLERNSYNYDSLKNAFDTLAFLFNKSQPELSGSGWNNGNQSLDQLSKITFNNQDLNLSDTLKKSILTANKPGVKEVTTYRIYIQCMPDFNDLSEVVGKLLKRNKYLVPGIETIEKISFNPQVRYFHDEDLNEAKKIASLINRSDPYFKDFPIKILRPDIKSPLHQFEIWIGQYKQMQSNMYMQQNAPNNRNNK